MKVIHISLKQTLNVSGAKSTKYFQIQYYQGCAHTMLFSIFIYSFTDLKSEYKTTKKLGNNLKHEKYTATFLFHTWKTSNTESSIPWVCRLLLCIAKVNTKNKVHDQLALRVCDEDDSATKTPNLSFFSVKLTEEAAIFVFAEGISCGGHLESLIQKFNCCRCTLHFFTQICSGFTKTCSNPTPVPHTVYRYI